MPPITYITTHWKTSLAGAALFVLAGLSFAGVSVPGFEGVTTQQFVQDALIALGFVVAKG